MVTCHLACFIFQRTRSCIFQRTVPILKVPHCALFVDSLMRFFKCSLASENKENKYENICVS